MKKIITSLLVFIALQINAQTIFNPAGSPYLEGVCYSPSFTDAFSCAANPAAVTNLNGFAAGVYVEKKYLIEGLNLAGIAFAYGTKRSGAGIHLKYFGNPAYNEIHASLNYGKNLGDVNIGASFIYNSYSVAGFYKLSVVCIGFHSLWKISDKFYTSLQLVNPPFSRLQAGAIREEAEYYLGLGYEVSPAVCVSITLQKSDNIPLQVNGSLQYRFGEKFYAKVGLFTAGPQPFMGLGWRIRDVDVQFSICYHPALGATPGMLFTYEKTGGTALQ